MYACEYASDAGVYERCMHVSMRMCEACECVRHVSKKERGDVWADVVPRL
jgi:hypothetical protein